MRSMAGNYGKLETSAWGVGRGRGSDSSLPLPAGACARHLPLSTLVATANTTAGGQDERRCKYTPPGFPPPTGWLGFNASGALSTATGLSRHGREDAREAREQDPLTLSASVSLFFFFSFLFSFL